MDVKREMQRWGLSAQCTAVWKARWLAALRWRRAVQRVLAPYQLSFTQWLVLDATQFLILAKGDAVNQNDVAAHLQMSRKTVSDAMIALANKDLVSRGPDMHMPAWRIFVFDEGKDMLRHVGAGIDAVSQPEG